MSSASAISSRAPPRCQTCRKPMKGNHRMECISVEEEGTTTPDQPASDAQPMESISSVPLDARLDSTPETLSRSAKSSHAMKGGKSARFLSPLQPARYAMQPSCHSSADKPPLPTIEDVTAFLLGIDHPVDPAKVQFALALLDELEGPSRVKDLSRSFAAYEAAMMASKVPTRPTFLVRCLGIVVKALQALLYCLLVVLLVSGLTFIALLWI
ncbi:hypothetical protein BKA70DRAFT_1225262 [Coprinopsis sp. MPI-PUGE-AT-0042]|nr:hypothetical protein BKA70DRAFT_1225262 [Coprinopsis sp. MPI-PUGE-AT-0042]